MITVCLVLQAGRTALFNAAGAPTAPTTPRPRFDLVPGTVIDHSPASSRAYVGSPSLAIWTNGDYVASHDFFGPGSGNNRSAVFGSSDRGATWQKRAELEGQWWSTLFVHRGALYILGTTKEYGNAVIRRSLDGGRSWTTPASATTGLLRDDGQYHCAPMPVILHQGRLWRGMERRDPPRGWGVNFCASMISAPQEADLLSATNWTFSNFLPGNTNWLGGTFGGWLEGNAVEARDGQVLDILRVDTVGYPEKAAVAGVNAAGRTVSFDPQSGFIDFPGGAKKFTIRYDPKSDCYWSLATMVPDRHQGKTKPGGVRNTLALTCSSDLTNWSVRSVLLYHPDPVAHGFQYVDWLFEGEDIVAACRTAFDDGLGGAHNNHDANFLTFHRITNFRTRSMADSVPMDGVRTETRDFIVTGWNWSLKKLADGEKAFANRDYVWEKVPAEFRGWRYTQTSGGVPAQIRVKAKRDFTLYLATASSLKTIDLSGWSPVQNASFNYTDKGATRLNIHTRSIKAGEEVTVPQGNWAGGLVLVQPE